MQDYVGATILNGLNTFNYWVISDVDELSLPPLVITKSAAAKPVSSKSGQAGLGTTGATAMEKPERSSNSQKSSKSSSRTASSRPQVKQSIGPSSPPEQPCLGLGWQKILKVLLPNIQVMASAESHATVLIVYKTEI